MGVLFFVIATILANILSDRINACERLYDIEMTIETTKKEPQYPKKSSIYSEREAKINCWIRSLQYAGVFGLAIAGGIICIYRLQV
jgi:hypothetical protein